MSRPKPPGRALKVTKRAGPVIKCPNSTVCDGECSVVMINQDRLIRRSDSGVLAVCVKCWRPRFIGEPTAARMTTVRLPHAIRVDLQRRMRWSETLKGFDT